MAKNSSSSAGGIIGLVLGFIVIAGIAGTPFYLGMLQSPEQAVDAASHEHVELVRRAVLAADVHLSALSDMHESLTDAQRLDSDEIDALIEDHPDLMEPVLKSLNQSAQMLRESQSADQKRGITVDADGTIQSGKPNARSAFNQFKGKYLNSATNVLRQADAAIKDLKSVRAGQVSGDSRLAGSRIQAILRLSEGRMSRVRAEYEQGQASVYREAARRRAEEISVLNDKAGALETQKPGKVLSDLQSKISEQESQTADLADRIASLEADISERESQLKELEGEAASAHEALGDLNPHAMHHTEYRQQYAALASQARTAEAQAAAVLNGTLAVSGDEDAGTPVVGLRDLRLRLEHTEELHTRSQDIARLLNERRDELTQLATDLTSRQNEIAGQIRELMGEMRDLMEAADSHDEKAAEATSHSLKALKTADQVCEVGIRAAKAIKQAASAGSAGNQDPYVKFVTSDKDAECAMHIIAAEIAYEAALAEYGEIASTQNRAGALAFVGRMTGEGHASSDGVGEEVRERTVKYLEAAKNSYKTATNLLKQSSFKAPSGAPINGKELVWQIQIAQAAVEMLHALVLADEDPAASLKQKNAAHALLQEATKGREQSPALAPAIDTLFYLRDSVQ